MSDWISDVEQKIEASPDFKADLPEKKSDLERYKVQMIFIFIAYEQPKTHLVIFLNIFIYKKTIII